MAAERKKTIFERLRSSLLIAGMDSIDNETLLCPLCWHKRKYEELSVEHIVPRTVGGRAVTVTCTECNNSHGSDFDSHLAKFQSTTDAFKGHGSLSTVLNINGQRLVVNLEWRDGQKRFVIVGKASDPKVIASVQNDFASGNVSEFDCTILYEYAKANFYTSILRSAYLALFDRFGYEYAMHDVVQSIRRKICDRSLLVPDLDCLIVELRNVQMPYESSHYIIRCEVESTECFLVAIRVRKATTTYLGTYLPNTAVTIEQFQGSMERLRSKSNGNSATIKVADFVR